MSMQEHPICSKHNIFGITYFLPSYRLSICNLWYESQQMKQKKTCTWQTKTQTKNRTLNEARQHNIRILKRKSLLKRQTNICWKNWNAFSFSWESIIMKNDVPLLFEAWQVTYMVEGPQDIRIDSPDNIHSKEENPNKLSSRNNPERSIHNDRESPQPETWITRALLPITQQI